MRKVRSDTSRALKPQNCTHSLRTSGCTQLSAHSSAAHVCACAPQKRSPLRKRRRRRRKRARARRSHRQPKRPSRRHRPPLRPPQPARREREHQLGVGPGSHQAVGRRPDVCSEGAEAWEEVWRTLYTGRAALHTASLHCTLPVGWARSLTAWRPIRPASSLALRDAHEIDFGDSDLSISDMEVQH